MTAVMTIMAVMVVTAVTTIMTVAAEASVMWFQHAEILVTCGHFIEVLLLPIVF